MMTPVIIVGGIVTGVFTPTKAAIGAAAYAIFLGIVIYRTLNLRKLMAVSLGFVAQIDLRSDFPLPQTDSAHSHGTWYAKRCEAV